VVNWEAMLRLFGCAMLLGFLTLTWAVTPAKKAPAKKTVAKSSKKAPSKTTARTSAKKGSSSRPPARKVASWRTRQAAPTPERYRQIQGALAAKGYLQPEDATGVWNSNSIDALKRFQAEQKIESTGKINSLSLIALGLGPKRESVASLKPPVPVPVQ
jgi:hypothetical protein